MTTYHFHVNPPTKGAQRATFTGVVENQTIKIGLATCSKKDQFDRKKGRLISTGRAITKPLFTINVENKEVRDYSDTFVRQCKVWAEDNNYDVNYPRRRKKTKQVQPQPVEF